MCSETASRPGRGFCNDNTQKLKTRVTVSNLKGHLHWHYIEIFEIAASKKRAKCKKKNYNKKNRWMLKISVLDTESKLAQLLAQVILKLQV